jgi:uncharacterized protein YbjT (DUF2867 family)
MILVTGATGKTGSQVVRALRDRGAPVRAFVRDAERARDLLGADVELAAGDFADAASVRAALDGIERMLLSCADDPRRVEWETDAIDAAVEAGVGRIVKLSTTSSALDAPVAYWTWHGRVDDYLRAANVDSVVLRSSCYMSNLLANADAVAQSGTLYAPAGEARIAMIDARDVGAVAVEVLTSTGHGGRTYELTGPAAITYADMAAELSVATGQTVEYVNVPDAAAHQGMIDAGMPEFVADQVVRVFQQLRLGVAADVTDTVEALTGSAPHDFAAFAHHHAHVFLLVGVGAR